MQSKFESIEPICLCEISEKQIKNNLGYLPSFANINRSYLILFNPYDLFCSEK